MSPPRPLRAAIYTRKSAEEGLEQSFNSLDAQREACAAYIKSQVHEGWRPVKGAYDDGGFSGGSMERPALQRLLTDIEKKLIDIIVVYKVDRLTRALADFAKMVEIFDKHGVSFVSVTQQFNTTTSMGRLTLNVLLSFAQYEREITGERIRDKFAASRAKGMWMGGHPPLGYDIKERKLIVNETESKIVRFIFTRFCELGTVRKLKTALDQVGFRTKARVSASGRRFGSKPFARGALYCILRNRIYLGEVVHKKNQTFPGEHAAIIDQALWDKVQAQLEAKGQGRGKSHTAGGHLLTGVLYDENGNRMSPTHAVKRGKHYRYYVSQALLQHHNDEAGAIKRIAASAIEAAVVQAFTTRLKGAERRAWAKMTALEQLHYARARLARVELRQDNIAIMAKPPNADTSADHACDARAGDAFTVPLKMVPRGGTRVMVAGAAPANSRPDKRMIKAVARAWVWREALATGRVRSVTQIAEQYGYTERYVRHMLQLAFLSPSFTEAIVQGRQRPDLTLARLRAQAIPLSWAAQQRML